MTDAVDSSTTTTSETAPPRERPLMKILLLGVFVGVVVAVECLAAYFLLPSPEQVNESFKRQFEEEEKIAKADDEEAGLEEEEGPVAEVDLGEFSVTLHQVEANVAYRVDFKLAATVSESKKSEFDEVFTATNQRFRDMVITEVRNSKVPDLTDSSLGLIKRKILEKSNDLFGAPHVKRIMFPEFSLMEQ